MSHFMVVLPENKLPLKRFFKTYVVIDVISAWYVKKTSHKKLIELNYGRNRKLNLSKCKYFYHQKQ